MKLSEWPESALRDELRHETKPGIHTMTFCLRRGCGKGARRRYCADCIRAELARRNDTSVNWPEAKPIEEHE